MATSAEPLCARLSRAPAPALLVLAAPRARMRAAEVAAVHALVRGGGALLLLLSEGNADEGDVGDDDGDAEEGEEEEEAGSGLRALLDRAAHAAVEEVIVATNFTAEGEATAHAVSEALKSRGLRVTRLARGVPVGSELEYVDLGTIAHALVDRR